MDGSKREQVKSKLSESARRAAREEMHQSCAASRNGMHCVREQKKNNRAPLTRGSAVESIISVLCGDIFSNTTF
jgi:hypothetical protein